MNFDYTFVPDGLSYEFIKNYSDIVDQHRNLVNGLMKIGLFSDKETLVYYKDIGPWQRGGGETFIASAEYKTNLSSKIKRCIAKVFVSFALPPQQQIEKMNERRQLLAAYGIRVPKKYGECDSILYEKYIPNDLIDSKSILTPKAHKEIAEVAAVIDHLRFNALNFLKDMRCSSDGNKVYYIDFGFDLGSPGSDGETFACYHQMKREFTDDFEPFDLHYNNKKQELKSRLT